MMNAGRKFVLDANVLIAAHRSYYAFDLCPGFWQSVLDAFAARRVFSTQRVKAELLKGNDVLSDWVGKGLPADFFLDDSTAEIAAEYGPMMAWVVSKGFLPAAQAKFPKDADGWLVAAAKQAGFCLVTHEIRQEGARARVPIPNVCDEFGVVSCNTFEMLRELDCAYH